MILEFDAKGGEKLEAILVSMETLVLIGIILGILLSIAGFLMLLKYRNFEDDKLTIVDDKINKLNHTLDSCDRMIDELNKLSDYIISNIENKSIELKSIIDRADEKINDINEKTLSAIKLSPLRHLHRMNAGFAKVHSEPDIDVPSKKENIYESNKPIVSAYESARLPAKDIEEKREEPKYIIDAFTINSSDNKDKTKMVAFVVNPKAKEVIELSSQGLDTTEIAKRLGIGKGEIELILGLKK